MDSLAVKVCTKCGAPKEASNEYFNKNKASKDGLAYSCKLCARAVGKAYAANPVNRERNRLRSAAYYQDNREECGAKQKEYYLENQEAKKLYAKEYRLANIEEALRQSREYKRKNRARVVQVNKLWELANPEKVKSYSKKYAQANPEKVNQKNHTRRARVLGAEGTHTAGDVLKQFAAQGGECYWCGCKLKKSGKGKYHVDHIYPLSKGGGNGPDNICCACSACNFSKGSKLPIEFAGRLF